MEERSSKLSFPLAGGVPFQKKFHLNFSLSPSPCFPEGRKSYLPLTFLAGFWQGKVTYLLSLFGLSSIPRFKENKSNVAATSVF